MSTVDKILNDSASRGPSTVAELLVVFGTGSACLYFCIPTLRWMRRTVDARRRYIPAPKSNIFNRLSA